MKNNRGITLKRKIILAVCAALGCIALATGVILPYINYSGSASPDRFMSAADGAVSKPAYTDITVEWKAGIPASVSDDYSVEDIKNLLTVKGTLDGTGYEEIDGSLYEVKLNGETGYLYPSNLSDNTVTVVYSEDLQRDINPNFTVTAAAIQSVELRVDTAYSMVGDYYMDGDYYAFVQGMSQSDVFGKIDIVLHFAKGERVVTLGTDRDTGLAVTSTSTDFGSSSSTTEKENYTVGVSVSRSGGSAVTASEEFAFRRLEVVGLELKDWTQPSGLTSASSISSLGFRSHVYPVYNTGESNSDTDNFTVEGSLAPTGKDIAAALDDPGYTYTKEITIKYTGSGASESVKPLSIKIKKIGYEAPKRIYDINGALPEQTVQQPINLGQELYIEFNYQGHTESVYLHEFDESVVENSLTVTFIYNDNSVEGKLSEIPKISKSIKEIQLSFNLEYDKNKFAEPEQSFSGDNLRINQIDMQQPTLDSFMLTYSDTDCSVTMSGVVSTDENPVEIELPDGVKKDATADGYKISFDRVGEFQITLKLTKGAEGDYQWTRNDYGQTNPARTPYVLTYTVQVGKNDVELVLNYDNGADRAYGDGEPARTVTALLSNGKSYSIDPGTPKGADDTDEIVYQLYYYGADWAGHNNANSATTTAPTQVGKYHVYAVSGENAYCNQSKRSDTVDFELTPKVLTPTKTDTLTGIQKSVTYDRMPHGIEDFVEVTGLVPGDNVSDVVEVTGGFTAITHVNESTTVKLSIKSTNKNYIWIGEKTTTDFECKIIPRELSFSVALGNDTYTYGDTSADLGAVITKNDAANFYAVIDEENPVYYYADADGNKGSALTGTVDLSSLPAGKYVIEYTTSINTDDGDLVGDYNLPKASAKFTVERKKLTQIAITPQKASHTYDGTGVTLTLENWVNTENEDIKDKYEDIFEVVYEGKRLTDNTTAIADGMSRADGAITLTEAGTYSVTVSFKNDNYEWDIDDGDIDEEKLREDVVLTEYVIARQEISIKIDGGDSVPYDRNAHNPELTTDTAPAPDGVDIGFTFEYYNSTKDEKLTELIAAGTYYVRVTGFACKDDNAGKEYNYVLPGQTDYTFIIANSALKKPELSKSKETYSGSIVQFEDIIKNWVDFDGKIKIDVLANGVKADLKDVIYKGEAVTNYVLEVVPADNYKWDNVAEGKEHEVHELYFTIDPLTVVISWSDTQQVYSGNALKPTAAVTNEVNGDSVTVTVGFANSEDTSAVDAGEYRVYAKSLDNGNYEIVDTYEEDFTVIKREVEKPTASFAGEFNGNEQSFTVENWKLADRVSATVSGTLNPEWFTGAGSVSVSGGVFDGTDGTLTVTNAGIYSVTLTLNDSKNYCWKGDDKTQDFGYAGSGYTYTIESIADIARKELKAPSLSHSGMKEGELNIQWTGSSIDKPTVNLNGYPSITTQHKSDEVKERGEYYVLLTVDSDNKYNYVWEQFSGEKKSYLEHNDFVPVYGEEYGARIYLYYAVTGQVLEIEYNGIVNYTFGDNGTGGTVDYGTFFALTGDVPDGAEMQTPIIVIKYYESENEVELEGGLPWNVGEYTVSITINFGNEDYQTFKAEKTFKVLPKVINAGDLSWDGNLSYVYNAEERIPVATLIDTAIPKRADGSSGRPEISVSVEGSAINVGDNYYVNVDTVSDGNYKIAEAGIREKFEITPYEINVKGLDKSFVYGEAIKVDGSFWELDGSEFFDGAEGEITVQLLKGENKISAKPDVGIYTVNPVWVNGNAQYAKNYKLTVTADGTLKITERKITVTIKEASSTYGETVNLYRTEVYGVEFTDGLNVTGNPLVDSAKSVFTLELIDCNGNEGKYGISATKVNSNYDVTFVNEVQYSIIPADIKGVSAVGYGSVYDGNAHAWFNALNRTLVKENDNKNSVKWYYAATTENGTTDNPENLAWTLYENNTVKNAGAAYYFLKVTADNHKPAYITTPVKVEVTKAVIYVQVSFTIKYGENSPADYDGNGIAYKATVEELIKAGGMYTVTGLVNGENIGDINIGNSFTYTTDYVKGDTENGKAGKYTITFDGSALEADNYTFENRDGVLTVQQFAFGVNIDDKSSAYYADIVELTYSIDNDSLPVSSFDGTKLVIPDSHGDIFTLATDADKLQPDVYAIWGERNNGNYSVTFAGSNGTQAKYTVTNATLTVSGAEGYNADYDEDYHPAITFTATAVDGSQTTAVYYKALISDTADADKIDWNGADILTAIPMEIDVCNYKLYYRITAANHDAVYGSVEVEISKAANSIETDGEISKGSWIYGEAYGEVTTEPAAKFTRNQSLTIRLLYSATADGEKSNYFGTASFATLKALFDEADKDGNHLNAGYYQLQFTYAATDNYGTGDGLESDLVYGGITFIIEKATLTVAASDNTITYGDDTPEYKYTYSGFVYEQNESVFGGDGKLPAFTSAYAPGYENGSVKDYTVSPADGKGESTLNGYLTNYTVDLVNGALTVEQRVVTIKIDDFDNHYNLQIRKPDGTPDYEAEKDWKNGYSVVGETGFYGDDDVIRLKTDALPGTGGIKTNDVGFYPIYAVFNAEGGYDWSKNYVIEFSGCSYSDSITDTDAIKQSGNNCAGTYEITQAELYVSVDGLYEYFNGKESKSTTYYNGQEKYYKVIYDEFNEHIDFVITYEKLDGNKVIESDLTTVVDAGSYRYKVTAPDNENYKPYYGDSSAFVIIPAPLTVTVNNATIQYGTEIKAGYKEFTETVGDKQSVRFSGFGFGYITSNTINFAQYGEDYLENLLKAQVKNFQTPEYTVTGYNPASTNADTVGCTVQVNNLTSSNFEIMLGKPATLTVQKRDIAVTVKGNENAKGTYTGEDQQGILNTLFENGMSSFLEVPQSAFGLAPYVLANLGVKLVLPADTIDVKEGGYEFTAQQDTSKAYNFNIVEFKYSESEKPVYTVEQKELTVTVTNGTGKEFNVIYGDSAPAFVASFNGFVFRDGSYENLKNRGDNSVSGELFAKTDYLPYASHAGSQWTVSYKNSDSTPENVRSTLSFRNYKINYVDATMTVVSRTVTASTADRYYEEDVTDGITDYHNGKYGKSHEAVITFGGVGTDDSEYQPEFTLSYNTAPNAEYGQAAGKAPTFVGEYTVTVTLNTVSQDSQYRDYVFAEGNSKTLKFNILQQEINEFKWKSQNININDDNGLDSLNNSIPQFIGAIMNVDWFQRAYGENTDIYSASDYTVSPDGLEFKAPGVGEYRITLSLNEYAQNNYKWWSENAVVTLTFYVTSDTVTITVEIDNWTYNEEAKSPVVTASNGNTANIRIDYALVEGGSDKVGQTVDSTWINAHALKFGGLPYNPDAGVYVIRASYPFDGTTSANDAYFVFEISKAKISAPVLGEHDDTYTGDTLSAYIAYDKNILEVSYGSLTVAGDGAFNALHANTEGYLITFAINSSNYTWDEDDADKINDGKAVVKWVVNPATDNVINWTLNPEERTVTYGGEAFAPKSYAKYGSVNYQYASVSSPDDWSYDIPYLAGDYKVKAVCAGNGDYNGCESVTDFTIEKAVLTATAHASVTFGETFDENGNGNYGYTFDGFVRREDSESVVSISGISYVLTNVEDGEKLNAGGDYRIALKTENGYVKGMEADNYFIVAAEGAFRVGKRAITVAIGDAQSSYSAKLYDFADKELSDKLLSVASGSLAYGESVADLDISLETTATANSNAGGYSIRAAGYGNGNYDITFIAGSYTVTRLNISLQITAGGGTFDGDIAAAAVASITSSDSTADMDRVRGELNEAIMFTYTGVQNDGKSYNSSTVPVYSGAYVATAVITEGAGNFTVDLPGVPFTVAKKTISTQNISAASKVYTGEVIVPEITDEEFAKYYTAAIEEYVNADDYRIVLTVKDEYRFDVQWTDGRLENSIVFVITKADNYLVAEIQITGWKYNAYDSSKNSPTAEAKYGDATKVFEYSAAKDGVYSATVPATANAGTYWVRVYVPEGGNYKAFVSEAVSFLISNSTNVVSMDDVTAIYGEEYTLSADTAFDTEVKFYFGSDRDTQDWYEAKPVSAGVYVIKAVSAQTGNYDSYTVYATLTIKKAILTAKVDGSGIYGDGFGDGSFTVTYEGFRYNDNENAVTVGEYVPVLVKDALKLTVGGYEIILKTEDGKVVGLTADNYEIRAEAGTFTVGRRAVTVDIANANSAYTAALYDLGDKASSDKLLSVTSGALAYGESVADLGVSLETTATAGSNAGGYTIRATGYGNGNYDITFREGVYTVTPLVVYVTVTAGGYTYGQTPVEAVYTLDIVGSEAEEQVREELENALSFLYTGRCNDGTYYNSAESAPRYAGAYVATLIGANGNYTLIGSTAQFTVDRLTIGADGITAASQVYTGGVLKPVLTDNKYSDYYTTDIESNFANGVYVKAGRYNVVLTLNDYNNVQWDNGGRTATVEFEITKATNSLTSEISIADWTYNAYDSQANAPAAAVKFGDGTKIFEYASSVDGVYSTGAPATGNAGTYWIRVTVPATDDYEAFVSDPVSFRIVKAILSAPTLTVITEGEGKNDAFTGYDLLSSVVGFNSALMNITYDGTSYVDGNNVTLSAFNSGVYTVKFTLINPENYVWGSDSTLDVNGNAMAKWTVGRMKLAKPTENTSAFVVSGSILTYIPVGFDENIMNIKGNRAGYGGTFTATVSLKDTDNYEWEDGSTGDITFTWEVVGISTVFVAVISIVSCLSSVAVVLAGAQFVMYRRKQRLDERAIDRRSEAEQRKAEQRGENK